MANRIKVAMRDAILGLWRQGWTFRRIARELGVHRKTVARHVRLAGQAQNGPNPTAGSDGRSGAEFGGSGNGPNLTAGSGPPSKSEPFRKAILERLDEGLSARRIWQDLCDEHGFTSSYESVKRFARRLGAVTKLPFRRMEVAPGAEAQVDFGRAAPILLPGARRRRPHLFRVVLSHSRRGYCQAVLKQSTDEFLGALENAFWHFGGVPRTIVVDNLKAAVTRADWFDPELNPKIEVFARHYGCVFMPTKPAMPRHKGKIEGGVKYAQNNALKGRVFESLAEQNAYLQEWEAHIADLRIHGTTKKQVRQLFDEAERDALLPLPSGRFPFFHEARRTVHRDGHVEVEKAYYSVPPEHVGHLVWARWDSRLVRVLDKDFREIAVHARAMPGTFKTDPTHISSKKMCVVERGADFLLRRAALIGPHARRWAEAMLRSRGITSLRVIQGLISLTRKHPWHEVDGACELALGHGAVRLRDVRALIGSRTRQTEFEFMSEHPIIRNMSDYGRVVKTSIRNGTADVVPIFGAPRRRPSPGEAGVAGLRSLSRVEES